MNEKSKATYRTGRCDLIIYFLNAIQNNASKQYQDIGVIWLDFLSGLIRGGARGVPGGATAPQKFCLAPQNFSGLFLKVLHRPLTAPLVAKLAPPVAPPNENVWLRPWVP